MPDDPTNLPARTARPLDRAAMERILARAAELQVRESGSEEPMLSEEQLVEVGKEVGISAEHVRRALAEERTRINLPEDASWAARMAGPGMAAASRVVPGTPAEVLQTLDRWMQREECLVVKRRYADRMTWEARRDLVGNIQRGLNIGGRGYSLARAHEVAATATAVDEHRSFVRLDADLEPNRASRLKMGALTTGLGTVVGGTPLALIGVIALHVALPVAIVGGVAVGALAGAGVGRQVAKSHLRTVQRAQLALEQLLDKLERNELPRESLLQALAAGRLPR